MLKRVLVANRGEIALRIVRACHDLGIEAVAAHSEVDAGQRFVREADGAVLLGPAPASRSYLSVERVVEAAREAGADAVHPGYGFLSENPALARAVVEAGLTFVGPRADTIEALGSKLRTREIMHDAGVPIPPGSDAARDLAAVRAQAAEIGFPLLVKPSGGGGGRGMRRVESADELEAALERARSEAAQSFGDGDVYLEKVITGARHIEVQIMADEHGNVVHVGDRDCSMQRRHQKVVEEAPAPSLTDAQRARVRELAVKAARAAKYVSAGTVEFLQDAVADEFYVLEVNTRIQVEHCVTEMVSGLDLVAEQLRVASGERLGFTQDQVHLRGHAIECRLYAEEPERGFLPSPGRITAAHTPGGPWIREDAGFEVGDEITPHYDGMLSKLVAWGPTREQARARMARALREYRVEGIATNLAFLRWLVATPGFAGASYDIGFIEREFRPSTAPATVSPRASVALEPEAAAMRKAPPPATAARAVRVFHYHHDSPAGAHNYLIYVVETDAGDVEAIPVSPTQQWADAAHRRRGGTAAAAVDRLVREVLSVELPSEVFPELRASY